MIITTLTEQYAMLSNKAEVPVMYNGILYPSVENAYQASRMEDEEKRSFLTKCTPAYAERMGLSLTIRPDKIEVMQGLLHQKFTPGSKSLAVLKSTGSSYICYGNTNHDNEWGACTCEYCVNREHQNLLGEMLMEIRDGHSS